MPRVGGMSDASAEEDAKGNVLPLRRRGGGSR